MNRQNLLKAFQTKDDKLMFARLLDVIGRRDVVFSDFIDPHRAEIIEAALVREGFFIFKWGGLPVAERVVLRISELELPFDEENFPITRIKINRRGLAHKDVLGAFSSALGGRDKIGDIIVLEDSAFALVKTEAAETVCQITEIGRLAVFCEKTDFISFDSEIKCGEQLSFRISSLRADCAVASAFALSRSQTTELFRKGRVFLNWHQAQDLSRPINQNDSISIRGIGKIKITEINTGKNSFYIKCVVFKN
ncbi:MAG: hypothetical protein LBM16_04345 [Clostridiales bacterium]|jgi:RNA-binding protein YlmH|nr:hypothetical protein [Clostridiales bacterium]